MRGRKDISRARVRTGSAAAGLLIAAHSVVFAASAEWEAGLQRFELVQGEGDPLCSAYVGMLRSIAFEEPPYCGRRPDTDQSAFGFDRLGWKKLDANTEIRLAALVPYYFQSGRLDYLQKAWTEEERIRKLNPRHREYLYRQAGVTTARERLLENVRRGVEEHQRAGLSLDVPSMIDPAPDIDNDGQPDQLVLWPGESGRCASLHGGRSRSISLYGVLLSPAGDFDARRTDEVFRHPGSYFGEVKDARGRPFRFDTSKPRYLVRAISVLKFSGASYFDGLLDGGSDPKESANVGSTFGVFEHRNGITRMRCEVRWMGSSNSEGTSENGVRR